MKTSHLNMFKKINYFEMISRRRELIQGALDGVAPNGAKKYKRSRSVSGTIGWIGESLGARIQSSYHIWVEVFSPVSYALPSECIPGEASEAVCSDKVCIVGLFVTFVSYRLMFVS